MKGILRILCPIALALTCGTAAIRPSDRLHRTTETPKPNASALSDNSATLRSGYIPVSGGGSIYYEEAGSGEPLFLLHGHTLDRRMWDPQFETFSRKYRTIRIDFRGYGRSSRQADGLHFMHLDDLLTVMDSLHIERAHVVGLSMGAFIAGDMLAMAPERMLSCVMASGGIRALKGPHEPMDSLESAQRDREIAEVARKGLAAAKREWLEQLVSGGGSRREEIREPLRRMVDDWDGWQLLHKEARAFWAREAFQALEERRPDVPTLMFKGEYDLHGKPYRPRELRCLPRIRAVVLRDCGHMSNMEQPEAFSELVLRFLEGGVESIPDNPAPTPVPTAAETH